MTNTRSIADQHRASLLRRKLASKSPFERALQLSRFCEQISQFAAGLPQMVEEWLDLVERRKDTQEMEHTMGLAATDIQDKFYEHFGHEIFVDAGTMTQDLALDTSLERGRALHRVWRALNDGDCPKCHQHGAATAMVRFGSPQSIQCPRCLFTVHGTEIEAIEKLFAPAMDAAVAIFETWREEQKRLEVQKTS